MADAAAEVDFRPKAGIDWAEVARLVTTSRAMDELEETRLVPEKKVLYQFSARGHDMAQAILGMHLRDGDAACGYYRSRPMLLALGVPLADALGSGMGREGGYSDGRDIGSNGSKVLEDQVFDAFGHEAHPAVCRVGSLAQPPFRRSDAPEGVAPCPSLVGRMPAGQSAIPPRSWRRLQWRNFLRSCGRRHPHAARNRRRFCAAGYPAPAPLSTTNRVGPASARPRGWRSHWRQESG